MPGAFRNDATSSPSDAWNLHPYTLSKSAFDLLRWHFEAIVRLLRAKLVSRVNVPTSCPMEKLEQYERQLRSDGFCLVEEVVPAGACEQIRDRLIKVAQRCRVAKPAAKRISFVPGVINEDQSFAPYLADQRVLTLAERLLGPNFRVSFTSALINEPGKQRTNWHADWPFNQDNACHVPAPYPDRVMHLTALIMLSPFTEANGGTLLVPGSHRASSNPTDPGLGIDPTLPHPTEYRVTGRAGSLLLFDSRLWHCPPANPSAAPRVALGFRYAPWWLNLEALDPDSDQRQQLVTEPGLTDNIVPRVDPNVWQSLPENVQPLLRHWIGGKEG